MEADPLSTDPADPTLATPEEVMPQAETWATPLLMPTDTTLGATLRREVAQHSLGETDPRSFHQQPGARFTTPSDDTQSELTDHVRTLQQYLPPMAQLADFMRLQAHAPAVMAAV